ncbi:MAG: FkbM family methyltransferase [Candidatus Paceibacterota bacterium]|jgi:FkbM family methyltransferase
MSRITKAELAILDSLIPKLPQSPVIVDGGGGHGEWTLEVLKRWPEAYVIVCEPHPMNRAICCKNLWPNDRISILPVGLAATAGEREFWSDSDIRAFGSSLHRRPHHFETPIMVPCTTLGELVTPGSWLDFVKLDLEGGELDAIRGLGNKRPYHIQFEYGDPWIDAGADIGEAFALLQSYGYTIKTPIPTTTAFENILAER